MPRGFPVKKMKSIQSKIQEMDDDNQRSVLRIIQDDNVMYTENTNGVFFDIMTLQKETLDKIMKLIEFCDNCNEYLSKREQEQTAIKMVTETTEDNLRM